MLGRLALTTGCQPAFGLAAEALEHPSSQVAFHDAIPNAPPVCMFPDSKHIEISDILATVTALTAVLIR
jgi:hypothetical protein